MALGELCNDYGYLSGTQRWIGHEPVQTAPHSPRHAAREGAEASGGCATVRL
jgi:hypothetical protein